MTSGLLQRGHHRTISTAHGQTAMHLRSWYSNATFNHLKPEAACTAQMHKHICADIRG